MSEILGKIGGLFKPGNLGTTAAGGSVGLGELGNIISAAQRGAQISSLAGQEKKLAALSPAALTKLVQSAEAPMNQGLEQSVGNQVQGDLAQRGLSQAPGIFAATEAQALGPLEQQNYNTALTQVLQQLGLPLSYASEILKSIPPGSSMAPAIQLLLQQLKTRQANANQPTWAGPGASPGTTPPTFDPSTAPTDPGSLDLTSLGVNG